MLTSKCIRNSYLKPHGLGCKISDGPGTQHRHVVDGSMPFFTYSCMVSMLHQGREHAAFQPRS